MSTEPLRDAARRALAIPARFEFDQWTVGYSVRNLAQTLGVSTHGAHAVLKDLQERGEITVNTRNGCGLATRYVLHYDVVRYRKMPDSQNGNSRRLSLNLTSTVPKMRGAGVWDNELLGQTGRAVYETLHPLTASSIRQVSQAIGVSWATAREYLARLQTAGLARVDSQAGWLRIDAAPADLIEAATETATDRAATIATERAAYQSGREARFDAARWTAGGWHVTPTAADIAAIGEMFAADQATGDGPVDVGRLSIAAAACGYTLQQAETVLQNFWFSYDTAGHLTWREQWGHLPRAEEFGIYNPEPVFLIKLDGTWRGGDLYDLHRFETTEAASGHDAAIAELRERHTLARCENLNWTS